MGSTRRRRTRFFENTTLTSQQSLVLAENVRTSLAVLTSRSRITKERIGCRRTVRVLFTRATPADRIHGLIKQANKPRESTSVENRRTYTRADVVSLSLVCCGEGARFAAREVRVGGRPLETAAIPLSLLTARTLEASASALRGMCVCLRVGTDFSLTA